MRENKKLIETLERVVAFTEKDGLAYLEAVDALDIARRTPDYREALKMALEEFNRVGWDKVSARSFILIRRALFGEESTSALVASYRSCTG